jgi:DNA-directed RNA polymerase subunit RPC12/RpoP
MATPKRKAARLYHHYCCANCGKEFIRAPYRVNWLVERLVARGERCPSCGHFTTRYWEAWRTD